jgi:hypothetical protein
MNMKSMNILKTVRYFLGILGILGAAALALACEQITEPPSGTEAPAASGRKLPAISGGMGRVIISASTGSAALEESAAPAESADSTESGVLPGITRTILPTEPQAFSSYKVVFSRTGYTDIIIDNAQGMNGAGLSRELEAGLWTVTVSAYRTFPSGSVAYEAARGSKYFTVTAGQTMAVPVDIGPVPEAAGQGLFTYTVTFPQGASGWLTFENEDPVPLVSGVKVSVEKGPGYYDLSVSISKGTLHAGLMEKVHIYAGLESKAEFEFEEEDFASKVYLAGTVILSDGATIASVTIRVYKEAYTTEIGTAHTNLIGTEPSSSSSWIVGVPVSDVGAPLYSLAAVIDTEGKPYVGTWASGGPVEEAGTRGIGITANAITNDLADVTAYLKAVSGGESDDDPVPLPLTEELDLTDFWDDLLRAIADSGKYVDLDLSACTMTGTEFDPGTDNTGENKIVSLVLPDDAQSIKEGAYFYSTFGYFTNLKSVSGSGIETVGDYAFADCTSLEEVDLPEATDIGDYAFSGCVALETVVLEAATDIGHSAFAGCSTLGTVELKAATDIGQMAFSGCVALETVVLEAARSIGQMAFSGCVALTEVNLLGSNSAPDLGSHMFHGIDYEKHITVYVPNNENAGYGVTASADYIGNDPIDPCWANGFRGGGWRRPGSDSEFDYVSINDINNNIKLHIQYGP